MPLTPTQQAAVDRLSNFYNSNPYNVTTNPGGLAKGGHRANLVNAFKDFALIADSLSSDVGSVAASAASAAAAVVSCQTILSQVQAIANTIGSGGQIPPSDPGSLLDRVPYTPILDFQFTSIGGWVGGVARNSTGSYFGSDGKLKWSNANEVRLTYDPMTQIAEGVLVERNGGTNDFLHTEDFTQSVWVKGGGVTVTANDGTAPDGQVSADRLNGQFSQTAVFPSAVSGKKCGTIFVEGIAATSIVVQIDFFNSLGQATTTITGTATINLTNGSTSASGSSGFGAASAYVKQIGVGKYRVGVRMAGGFNNQAIKITYTPNGTARFWGAMLESSDLPSSYISSGAAKGTRAAETFTLPFVPGSWNASEGALYAEFQDLSEHDVSGSAGIAQLDSGSVTNSLQMKYTGGQLQVGVNNGTSYGSRSLVAGINRLATGWSSAGNDCVAANSQAAETPSFGAPSSAPNIVRLGEGHTNSGNMIMRRLVLWGNRPLDSAVTNLVVP